MTKRKANPKPGPKTPSAARASSTRGAARSKTGDKPAEKPTDKPGAKPTTRAGGTRSVKLLAGGNPQIAKADGDAPVQAYLDALPGWKREVGRRLDALVVRSVPGVRKAVKWNSPLYGIEGRGWFLGVHAFTRHLKLAFFHGSSLRPPPPGASAGPGTRYLDIREGDILDEAQLASWMEQAAALPGWGAPSSKPRSRSERRSPGRSA